MPLFQTYTKALEKYCRNKQKLLWRRHGKGDFNDIFMLVLFCVVVLVTELTKGFVAHVGCILVISKWK